MTFTYDMAILDLFVLSSVNMLQPNGLGFIIMKFKKRTYKNLKELARDLWFPIRNMRRLNELKNKGLISLAFQERLMLAVTAVTRCRYCSYFHTRQALKSGLTPEETGRLLSGYVDNCPEDFNADQLDNDSDSFGDVCDVCPDTADNQIDSDSDGFGDACDTCQLDPYNDSDGDGICGNIDLCDSTASGSIINENGCSIEDICQCDADWQNHHDYLECIGWATKDFQNDGLISKDERKLILAVEKESNCGAKD